MWWCFGSDAVGFGSDCLEERQFLVNFEQRNVGLDWYGGGLEVDMDEHRGSFVAVRRISQGLDRSSECHSTSGM